MVYIAGDSRKDFRMRKYYPPLQYDDDGRESSRIYFSEKDFRQQVRRNEGIDAGSML